MTCRRSWLHPLRSGHRLAVLPTRLLPPPTVLSHRVLQQELLGLGRDLRGCRRGRSHGRPARPPLPRARPQRRQLPTEGQTTGGDGHCRNHLDRAVLNRRKPRGFRPAADSAHLEDDIVTVSVRGPERSRECRSARLSAASCNQGGLGKRLESEHGDDADDRTDGEDGKRPGPGNRFLHDGDDPDGGG